MVNAFFNHTQCHSTCRRRFQRCVASFNDLRSNVQSCVACAEPFFLNQINSVKFLSCSVILRNPASFNECVMEHCFCFGRILRPVHQPSSETILSCRPGIRIYIEIVDAHGGASNESVFLNVLCGLDQNSIHHNLNADFFRVILNESDRFRRVGSSSRL